MFLCNALKITDFTDWFPIELINFSLFSFLVSSLTFSLLDSLLRAANSASYLALILLGWYFKTISSDLPPCSFETYPMVILQFPNPAALFLSVEILLVCYDITASSGNSSIRSFEFWSKFS